jgi:hypothetical protein
MLKTHSGRGGGGRGGRTDVTTSYPFSLREEIHSSVFLFHYKSWEFKEKEKEKLNEYITHYTTNSRARIK